MSPTAMHELSRQIDYFADNLKSESDRIETEVCLLPGVRFWPTVCRAGASSGLKAASSGWKTLRATQQQKLSLMSAPVEVGPILRDQLFKRYLQRHHDQCDAGDRREMTFAFFRSRIGLTDGRDERQGSPFDYQQQARLILSTNMPDPSARSRDFQQECCRRIQRHLLDTEGRAFVLFTSYSMMMFLWPIACRAGWPSMI